MEKVRICSRLSSWSVNRIIIFNRNHIDRVQCCMCYTNWKHLNVWGHCVILYFRWLHFTFVRYGVPNSKGNFHLARKFCVVFNLHAMTRRDQSRPIAIERACNRCSLADYNFPAFHFYSIIGDCFFSSVSLHFCLTLSRSSFCIKGNAMFV